MTIKCYWLLGVGISGYLTMRYDTRCMGCDTDNIARHTAYAISYCDISNIYHLSQTRLVKTGLKIVLESSQPANSLFRPLPSGRRLRSIRSRSTRFSNSTDPPTNTPYLLCLQCISSSSGDLNALALCHCYFYLLYFYTGKNARV